MSKTTLSVKPTRRQYQVMTMLSSGMKHKEIAALMYRSPHTVNSNLKAAALRLNISLNEIRSFCIAQNWIDYKIKPYEEIEPIKIDDLLRRDW